MGVSFEIHDPPPPLLKELICNMWMVPKKALHKFDSATGLKISQEPKELPTITICFTPIGIDEDRFGALLVVT